MRNAIFALVCSLAMCACSTMSSTQKQSVASDVLLGLQVVAAGVAGMPGVDPTAAYWSKYALGVLAAQGNPTPAQ